MEEQEGEEEGRNQLQEELVAEGSSDGQKKSGSGSTTGQSREEPVPRGGGTPKKGTATEELQEIVNS